MTDLVEGHPRQLKVEAVVNDCDWAPLTVDS